MTCRRGSWAGSPWPRLGRGGGKTPGECGEEEQRQEPDPRWAQRASAPAIEGRCERACRSRVANGASRCRLQLSPAPEPAISGLIPWVRFRGRSCAASTDCRRRGRGVVRLPAQPRGGHPQAARRGAGVDAPAGWRESGRGQKGQLKPRERCLCLRTRERGLQWGIGRALLLSFPFS